MNHIQPTDFTITAPGVKLDLSMQVARYEYRMFVLILTWNYADDANQPVMMIGPTAVPRSGDDLRVCTVHMNDAWRWSRTHNSDRQMIGYHGFGKPPSSDEWQKANAEHYCDMLDIDRGYANHLRTKIEDHLEDLLMMPPAPPRDGAGHATFTQTNLQTGAVEEITVIGD